MDYAIKIIVPTIALVRLNYIALKLPICTEA